MRSVEIREAQRRLPELIEEAARGEEVVISRGDGASFRLVPISEADPKRRPRRGGGARGLITIRDDFDDPLPEFEPYT